MLEAEDNSSRPSPRPRTKFWPRGQFVLEDLTSMDHTKTDFISWQHFKTLQNVVFVARHTVGHFGDETRK